MPRLSLKGGDYLFRHGEQPRAGYLIEGGIVELRGTRPGRAGGTPKAVVLARLGRGDLVGDMAAIERTNYLVDAVVVSDAADVLAIDSDQLRERLTGADPILRMVLEGQMKRNRRMLRMLRGAVEPEMLEDAPDRDDHGSSKFRLEDELREALLERKLEVCYQPILEIASGRIVGYEALVRWNHPGLGAVDPEEFIRLAEETSLIMPVGEYVFDAACAALDALRDDPMPFVAVNVSARQLAAPGLIRGIVARRDALQLPLGCIKVEITESQALDPAQVAQVIDDCHAQGIGVSLDDFGTRYAHLAQLHRLAVDAIKIDQAFVREMLASERAMQIVRAIVAMGQAIGADLVVEGVETAEQLAALGRIGCGYAQGFLIGKAESLAAILANR